MAALKLILAFSTTLSKTFRTTRVGAKHSRLAWSCAKRAENASFLIRVAAVMWRTGGHLSVDSILRQLEAHLQSYLETDFSDAESSAGQGAELSLHRATAAEGAATGAT
jgi:hypothetical protein